MTFLIFFSTAAGTGVIAANLWRVTLHLMRAGFTIATHLIQDHFLPSLFALDLFIQFFLFDRLQQVKARTLVICARDDMVTPLYFTEELVRLISDARSYVLPDGGHFYPHVHGAEFCRVLTSFLLES